ncbi:MAG: group II intron reverse transcriptase/maturase, partial [Desulfobacterales bacterium]|nr:group II intron reverse transcriptase/maturase [Desulfobacterales bacterium]
MSFVAIVNPNGGVEYKRVMKEPFSNDHLLERILSTENVRQAWKQVRANKGAPGINGVTVDEFPDAFRRLWPRIRSDLLEGTYVPSPVLRTEIPKPDGSKRPLGIPIVLDRVVQQAIAQVMGPILDSLFSESSCGFRPGRSAHDGVRQVKQFIGQGFKIAVDTDLSKSFDKVNHDVLMVRVARRVKDKRVLRLIGKYLRAGVMVNNRLQATPTGVPQGGPLSPLLANILLDDLDRELEKRGHRFVRYADDCAPRR